MIIQILIAIVVLFITTIFSFFNIVTTLPTINGFDLDSALVTGVSQAYNFAHDVWPVTIVFQGWMFLLGYYGIKMLLKLFLGSRAPGNYN